VAALGDAEEAAGDVAQSDAQGDDHAVLGGPELIARHKREQEQTKELSFVFLFELGVVQV
jgi:hypothetical protein